MAEPSCDRLFDFDFEKRPGGEHEMSEAEVSGASFCYLIASCVRCVYVIISIVCFLMMRRHVILLFYC